MTCAYNTNNTPLVRQNARHPRGSVCTENNEVNDIHLLGVGIFVPRPALSLAGALFPLALALL